MSRYEAAESSSAPDRQTDVPARLRAVQRGLLILFGAASLAIAVGGCLYYRHEMAAIRDEAYNDVKAVGDLKAAQIVAWRNARAADARVNATRASLRTAVQQRLAAPGDGAWRDRIQEGMQSIRESYGYHDVILADAGGDVLFTLDSRLAALDEVGKQLVARAISARHVVFGDFFRCPACREVHVDVAAPITGANGSPVAAIILRSDPEQYLYPLLQSWPTPSPSAETLLVRRDGDDALFLSEARHRPSAALTLRIGLSHDEVPAVQAALGREGLFEGRDYRGVRVVSALRPVRGSPWVMVAKVDADEIFAEVRYRGMVALLLGTLAVAATGLMAAFIFRHRQRDLYRDLYVAERRRREVQEVIRTTLYSIGDAVIATDAEGRVARMNPVAERLTGWGEAEAAGRPLEEIFRIVDEETRAEVESPAARVMRGGAVVGLAGRTLLVARDGTERPVADSGAPIRNAEGEITGVVLVFCDQTDERRQQAALRQSEERYRTVADFTYDWEYWIGPDGRMQYVSPACERITGYRAEEFVARPELIHVLVHPEDRRLLEEHKASAFADDSGQAVCEADFRIVRRDGEVRWIAHTCRGIRRADGTNLGRRAVNRDITERKRAEQDLKTANARLEQAVARAEELAARAQAASVAKTEFLANMSHEIRTPMTAIVGFADLLQLPGVSDREQREFVEDIKRNARLLLQLIDDILDLAKVEAGRLNVQPAPCSPREIAEDVIAMLSERAMRKGVALNLECEASVPATIRTDPVRLRQILVNLVGNAVKFTERGRVRVGVRGPGPRAQVQYVVADTGIGISEDKVGALFQPFMQADASLTRKHGGSGLGLALSKRLANSLGGDIAVQSKLGEGSTFTVTIDAGPAPPAGALPATTSPAPAEQAAALPPDAPPCRVLLVEDDREVQKVVVRMLRRLNVSPEIAEDGEAACRRVRESAAEGAPYDLILMDIQMPTLDGLEATRRLRLEGWNGPIVALTAHAMVGDREKCLDAGCDDYVSKPLTTETLAQTLDRHLRGAPRQEA